MLWNFTVLGEAAGQLPGDFKANHPEVDWLRPSQLRNRIVHGYWSIDLRILHATAVDDLPGFVTALREVLAVVEVPSVRGVAAPPCTQLHELRLLFRSPLWIAILSCPLRATRTWGGFRLEEPDCAKTRRTHRLRVGPSQPPVAERDDERRDRAGQGAHQA